MALAPEAARWFESRRGIKRETIDAFGVHTQGRDLVFPYPGDLKKLRYSVDEDNPFGLEKDGRRFVWKDANGGPVGAGQVPFLPPGFEPGKDMLLLPEGETDTMAAWQHATATWKPRIVGLSGVNSWKPEYAETLFGEARRVFIPLDNDDPYEHPDAVKSVEGGWQKIKADLGKKARRVTLPQGINDLAEFFMRYDWPAFRVLLEAAAKPRMPYPRLDLSKEPGPVDWLLEGLIAAPDITVLWGDGGVSKSLMLQALAVAIVEGRTEFLGLPLLKKGRVLYIDEENPEDIVKGRLKKLGLRNIDDLYYVWYGGVRLDEEPDKFFDAVAEFDPVMVALDSFSRLQTSDENEAKAMNQVFNDAIYPVARKLGVPVLALHHQNKGGSIRGNTAIRNAADLSLKVEAAKLGEQTLIDTYRMFPDKPRRGQSTHLSYKVVGYDESGEPTDKLDEEVRVELMSLNSKEDAY